jgi:16S rRNA (guanine527-N7)-methyltransferase
MRVEGLPELPDAYGRAVDDGIRALGIELGSDARQAIDDHVRLLLAWNSAINLTAIREPLEIARLHVIDSLSALSPMRDRAIDAFVDIGSGGGFPGLPLAVAMPARRALLVESIGKKAAFLEAVAGAVGARRVAVAAARAEQLASNPDHRERWPAVLARAVASLADLVEIGFPLLLPGGWLIAWKRGDIDAEVGGAEQAIRELGGGNIEVVDAAAILLPGHRLVVIRKDSMTPSGWPRDPAVRRRRPW